jgi:(1->4)-alpha-D-glucan 1-alpha-D-glucosylmutase
VPDVYQSSELWDLALVDPDNRRPVDYEVRRRCLDEARDMTASQAWDRQDDGVAKLWLLHRALQLRNRRPTAFGPDAAYRALQLAGDRAPWVVAFARGADVVTVVPRLLRHVATAGWGDTVVRLPDGRWRGLDGVDYSGEARVCDLLDAFPVAILERTE